MELYDSRYYSGQGPVMLAERGVNGLPLGYTFIGDVGDVTLTPNVTTETVIENVTGSSGTGTQFITRVEYNFAMNMRSIKNAHLAISLQASNTAKASAQVQNEAHIAYAGKLVVLNNIKVSAVTVTNSAGTTTYDAGDDYILDAAKGTLDIPAGSAITDGSVINVDYTHAAQHHLSTNPGQRDYSLAFAGVNRADGNKQTRCEIYQLRLSPSSLNMISQNAIEQAITGTVILDTRRAAGDQFFSWKIED